MFLLLAVYYFKKPRVYLDSLPDQVVSKGDVNSDGEINSKYYILVRRNILGIGSLNGDAYIKADVSSNGIIGIEDTNWLREYILKKSENKIKLVQYLLHNHSKISTYLSLHNNI
jgi:hypothetical protein